MKFKIIKPGNKKPKELTMKVGKLFESNNSKSRNLSESLKEYAAALKYCRVEIDDYEVFIFSTSPLLEVKSIKFSGIYSAIEHLPRVTPGFKHIHLFAKGKEIGALNVNGSTHDSWHGVQLPNKVIDGIKNRFPKYNIPKNGLLEFIEPDMGKFIFILESLN